MNLFGSKSKDVPQEPERIQFKNPEEELAHLRAVVAEKERRLAQFGKAPTSEGGAEKLARETIASYKAEPSAAVLAPEFRATEAQTEATFESLAKEDHDDKVTGLLAIAREKGIKNAFAVLEKLADYHVTDDFHRFLAEYIRHGFTLPFLKSKDSLNTGLGLTLYEILIPENKQTDDGRPSAALSEIVSAMEQFYASMLSIEEKDADSWMSIEIASANFSQETIFYVAVPTTRKNLFEKSILSIFNNAKISEKHDDYNIFNQTGVTLGAEAKQAKASIYPIKTYEEFSHDPLNDILSSFSRIGKVGEGAAIQFIWSPDNYYLGRYKDMVAEIGKSKKPLKEIINEPTIGGEIKSMFKEVFFSKKEKGDDPIQYDQAEIAEIQKKSLSPIVKCNIRILASAESDVDAKAIFDNIKSSFNQFNSTSGNSIEWSKAEGGKLIALARNFSFRIFDESSALPLNIKELTTMMHLHTSGVSAIEGLKQTRFATAPAPLADMNDGITLGSNEHRNIGTTIRMAPTDRVRHFYAIGQTGTGKSSLLKEMIIQDIKNGDGVCMIDPHGSDIEDVLANIPPERFDDVIYFDPAHTEHVMALNILEFDESRPDQKTFVVNELFQIFRKIYGGSPEAMGPAFEQYFRNSALLVMEHPSSGNTLVDVSRVLSDAKYRKLKLEKCANPLVKQFWTNAEQTTGEQGLANYVQYVTNKFDVFLANDIMRPIISQEKSTFDFRDVMDNRKILLCNLSKGRLGEINASLIGLILVGKILMAALSRADSFAKNFPPFYLYIDEFQNVTTDSISTILSEARKYKLSLNVAHQFIAQLEEGIRDSVFGNVGTICSFRVGAEDAEYLEKQFSPVFEAKDLMNIQNYNAYIRLLVNGIPEKPFNIRIPPQSKGNPSIVKDLKELSYLTFGRSRAEVEAIITEKFAYKNPAPPAPPAPPASPAKPSPAVEYTRASDIDWPTKTPPPGVPPAPRPAPTQVNAPAQFSSDTSRDDWISTSASQAALDPKPTTIASGSASGGDTAADIWG